MATTVGRVTPPLDQAALFETVEDADELAAVEVQRVGDRRLRFAYALVEQREHAVVVAAEACGLERVHRLRLDGPAEPSQQKRGARDELAREAEAGPRGSLDWNRCHGE